MQITEKEIWKPIKGFEGFYEVSNLGRVKSLSRYVTFVKNGKEYTIFRKEHIKKEQLDNKGYVRLMLQIDKVHKSIAVHRAVAEAFIPNPLNLPQINHKDEIKTNNNVSNLEWCTNEYNCNYGNHPKRCSIKATESSVWLYKPVLQFSLDDEFIREWNYIREAANALNISAGDICKCCKGKRICRGKEYPVYSAGGFKWRYKEYE